MTDYRLYFKLIKRNIPQTMIYILFFIILTSVQLDNRIGKNFNQERYKLYWISEEETEVTNGLKQYLMESNLVEIVSIPIESQQHKDFIDDAIILNRTYCAIKVPKGFTEHLSTNKPIPLELVARTQDEAINKIAQSINAYIERMQSGKTGFNRQEYKNKDEIIKQKEGNNLRIYFNELIYGLSAVILVGIISVTYSINAGSLKQRRECAPQDKGARWFLLKSHLIYGGASLVFFIVFSLFWDGRELFTIRGLTYCLNASLLTINLVVIGYLSSLFVKNIHIQMMVTNLFTLGVYFISGTSVEQEYLSEQTIRIAQFLPTYWYVKANNLISNIGPGANVCRHEILSIMGIEVLFALAMSVICLVAHQQINEGKGGETI